MTILLQSGVLWALAVVALLHSVRGEALTIQYYVIIILCGTVSMQSFKCSNLAVSSLSCACMMCCRNQP